jgi:hypothetical protein
MKDQRVIGLDFDGVLAYVREDGNNNITNQDVIPTTKECILCRIAEGDRVILFTARARTEDDIRHLRDWLDKNGLKAIKKITNTKLPEFDEIWDDKAKHIPYNIGETDFLPRYRTPFRHGIE